MVVPETGDISGRFCFCRIHWLPELVRSPYSVCYFPPTMAFCHGLQLMQSSYFRFLTKVYFSGNSPECFEDDTIDKRRGTVQASLTTELAMTSKKIYRNRSDAYWNDTTNELQGKSSSNNAGFELEKVSNPLPSGTYPVPKVQDNAAGSHVGKVE